MRIATNDNLKRTRIKVVSRCWCCDVKEEEIMNYLFLTSPIAAKLWREFAIFAGIDIGDMNLQEIIMAWWTMKASPKLEAIFKAIRVIIMWNM